MKGWWARADSIPWAPESALREMSSSSPHTFTPPTYSGPKRQSITETSTNPERSRVPGPESKHRAPPGGNHGNPKRGAIKPRMENTWPRSGREKPRAHLAPRTIDLRGWHSVSRPGPTRKGHALRWYRTRPQSHSKQTVPTPRRALIHSVCFIEHLPCARHSSKHRQPESDQEEAPDLVKPAFYRGKVMISPWTNRDAGCQEGRSSMMENKAEEEENQQWCPLESDIHGWALWGGDIWAQIPEEIDTKYPGGEAFQAKKEYSLKEGGPWHVLITEKTGGQSAEWSEGKRGEMQWQRWWGHIL